MSSQTTVRSQSILPRSPAQHKHHVKLQIGLVGQPANAQRHVTCRNILQNAGDYAKPLQDLDTWSKLASIQEDELSITYEMYGLHVSHVVGFELTFRDARGVTQQLLLTDSKELQFAIGTLQQLFISCTVTKAVGNCPACITPPVLNILFEDEYFSSAVYRATGDARLRQLYNWDEEVLSDFSFQSMLGEDTYNDTLALTELDLGIEGQWLTSEPSLTQESTPPSQLLRQNPDAYIKPSLLVKQKTARSGICINPAGERTTGCPPLPFLPPSSTMTTSPLPLPSSPSQEFPSTPTPAPTLTPASAPVPAPTVVTPFHGCDPKPPSTATSLHTLSASPAPTTSAAAQARRS